MPNYNKVILMGHLTRDPELRHSQGGTAFCKFSIAVNSTYGTGDKRVEEVCFLECTTFGKQGEYLAEAGKGEPVFVEGRLKLEQWDDKDTGAKRSKIVVIAERVQKLGAKGEKPASRKLGPDGAGAMSMGNDEFPF